MRNYSAILTSTVYIHKEGFPRALINVLRKQFKDLFNHKYYCLHTYLPMAKITLRVSPVSEAVEKKRLREDLITLYIYLKASHSRRGEQGGGGLRVISDRIQGNGLSCTSGGLD